MNFRAVDNCELKSLTHTVNDRQMDRQKRLQTASEEMTDRDLSEQIKVATKESHVRAENTQLMLSYQRGQITLPQYKLLLCSLHEVYRALEEELDRNREHPGVAPVYFPAELARLPALQRDLEHFYGRGWREQLTVPAAARKYAQRLRQVGRESPELLLAHAYTRYLGDLSGGQVLGRITQKSLGLKGGEGLAFFSFPGVSSPTLFKQLYRGRMNSVELSEEQRRAMLDEAVAAFELNIQVFDGLQKMLSTASEDCHSAPTQSQAASVGHSWTRAPQMPGGVGVSSMSPLFRMFLGLFVALATVSMGMYAL